ncbi:MAG: prenyltransferase/squalene oxidase repeat-containing protein [Candidatus Thorarchaeota archaeon]
MNKVQVASIAIVLTLVAMSFMIVPISAETTRWQSVENYMKENYDDPIDNGEGGYSFPDTETSRLYPTVGAMMVYEEMDMLSFRPPVTDLVKIKNFTRKLQWKSGGEDYERWGGFSLYIAGPVSIENSYWAIKMWQLMEEQSDIPDMTDVEAINATAALVYVNKTQTTSGGFGSADGAPANLISTFYALYIMNAMLDMTEGSINDWLWNSTATMQYILNCTDGDAFKLTPESHIPSLSATAAGLLALNELNQLNALSPTEQQAMRNWIVERQVTTSGDQLDIGGFTESILTNDTNLESTFHALEILSLIGGIDSIDADLASRFIVDCQAHDGAWGNTPGIEEGSLFYAGLALKSLNLLDPINHSYRNLMYEADPNNPAPPLIDWRILFIAVLIIAAMAVAVVALRMD